MEHEARLALFWILHPALLGLFTAMCVYIAAVWLRARLPGLPPDASRWQKLWALLGRVLQFIFSRKLWPFLKALVLDGMIHRRLLAVSPLRWLIHIAVFGSFALLGLISIVTGVAVEILPGLFPADHPLNTNVFVLALRDPDYPAVAFVNEVLGLIIVVGMLGALYRRYVWKDPQLRTSGSDTFVLLLITFISVGGFLLESFRLLAKQPFAPTAGWAFFGYNLALALKPLNWDWVFWYNFSFWVHVGAVHLLLFYAPFSRFAHVVMSPLAAALNSMPLEEAPA